MAELKFKTRGMASPQGMPRVYFSCHPKDFEKCFEKISDDILKKQNCAIFYLDNTVAYSEEELFLDLGQMQLFVMPVTSNLLVESNRVLDSEFKFAIEKHIPVLPIMQENGLENLFNQKCGDLQFLDPNSKDLTAISYDEKLEKYLSSVLIGDELAAKVRAAFDAYVFLSYRKKDRKYAQELMRLIHKNEFCRDIAIWYDEFLTPGENFNDSIENALNKSGLFVMAVTPNLVNESNYIMSTEYPMAKDKNKLILPAELVETDRKLLEECYKDIPACTDAHNEIQLSENLLKAVQAMAKKENDSSPEHNFFIGLAYLSGIDVEVDHERAVSLITSAAEAGLPEAMKKLAEMYYNCIGVGVDLKNREKAQKWQEKYIEYLETIYIKSNSADDAYNLAEETFTLLFDMGGFYIDDIFDFDFCYTKEIQQFSKILKICLDLNNKTGSMRAKKYIIRCYHGLNIFMRMANYSLNSNEMIENSSKMIAINKQIVELINTPESLYELAESYLEKGVCSTDLVSEEECYLCAIEIFEKLVSDFGLVDYKWGLLDAYSNLLYNAERKEEPQKTKEYYSKITDLLDTMIYEVVSFDDRNRLIYRFERYGEKLKSKKMLTDAVKCFYKAAKIATQNNDREFEDYNYSKVIEICSGFEDCLKNPKISEAFIESKKKKAELYSFCVFSDSKENLEQSSDDEQNTENDKARLKQCIKLAEVSNIKCCEDEEKEHLLNAMVLNEKLVKKTNELELKRSLEKIYDSLHSIAIRNRGSSETDYKRGKLYIMKLINLKKNIAETTCDKDDIVRLEKYYSFLVPTFDENEVESKKECLINGSKIYEYLAVKYNKLDYYVYLASIYNNIAFVGVNCDRSLYDSEKEWMKKAYDLYKLLSEIYPGDDDYKKSAERTKRWL